ncbi:unknown [Firmicutes bacterium CAG:449]|nr:unknown [Firmicutes bacterium CAG:449]
MYKSIIYIYVLIFLNKDYNFDMELEVKQFDKVFYLDDYIYLNELLFKTIIESHQKNGYKRIFSTDYNEEIIFSKIDIYCNLSLKSYCFFNDEIKARSEALNLLKEYSQIIKKLFSLNVESGYLNSNDDFAAFIYVDNKMINILSINIEKKNNTFIVKANYKNSIIEIVNYYLLNYHLITPNIRNNILGGVILEENDHLTKLLIDELMKKYNIYFAKQEKAKEKYQFLENEGYQYILEFRKNGKLKIKCVGLEIYQEINKEEIDAFINDTSSKINDKLFSLSFKNTFEYIKNNKKTICEKCLLEKNYLFIPFNQRIKQNCAFCGKEGKINAIF